MYGKVEGKLMNDSYFSPGAVHHIKLVGDDLLVLFIFTHFKLLNRGKWIEILNL